MSSAAAAPTKSPKKRAISQKRKTSPSVSDLILKAASLSAERGGVSLVALKKALESGGYDVKKNRARIRLAIRRLVASKSLVQIKGTGASGSFKLNKKPPSPLKKRVVKKKPKAKIAKRVGTRKAAEAAAPVVKKSPKKKMAKTLKKAKRPAAAKKPKSPRTLKRAVMSTRSRAAAKK